MGQVPMALSMASRDIINLANVYDGVRADNPMGGYTYKLQWAAQDYPGTTFGEPLSNASSECLDVREEDVTFLAVPENWQIHHDRRTVVEQGVPNPLTCRNKTLPIFKFLPMISPQDHAFMAAKMKTADAYGRLQTSWNSDWQTSVTQATFTMILEHFWGV